MRVCAALNTNPLQREFVPMVWTYLVGTHFIAFETNSISIAIVLYYPVALRLRLLPRSCRWERLRRSSLRRAPRRRVASLGGRWGPGSCPGDWPRWNRRPTDLYFTERGKEIFNFSVAKKVAQSCDPIEDYHKKVLSKARHFAKT